MGRGLKSGSMPKTKRGAQGYLESGDYLPAPLRDFHDQKTVFKYLDEVEARRPIDITGWMGRHVYVIDYFLWVMARHGWTLQRSRAPVEFENLRDTLNDFEERRLQQMARIFDERFSASADKTDAT